MRFKSLSVCRISEIEGQQEIDRADLEQMLKDLIPDWSPAHLQEDIELMPILQIQQVTLDTASGE